MHCALCRPAGGARRCNQPGAKQTRTQANSHGRLFWGGCCGCGGGRLGGHHNATNREGILLQWDLFIRTAAGGLQKGSLQRNLFIGRTTDGLRTDNGWKPDVWTATLSGHGRSWGATTRCGLKEEGKGTLGRVLARGGLRGAGWQVGGRRQQVGGGVPGPRQGVRRGGGQSFQRVQRGRVPMGGDAFVGEVGDGFAEGTKIWRRFALAHTIGRTRGGGN
jgi:hypothetical protein